MSAVALENRTESRPVKIPFRVRFSAWWQGYDPADVYAGDPVALEFDTGRRKAAPVASAGPPKKKVPLWTADRIQVAERLWGAGMHTPGGDAHVQTLVKPFGLNPTMTVLDLGAGLGGCSRSMAKTYGSWVTGFEQWPILAEAGMLRSRMAGLDKKAPIELYDPLTTQLKPRGYNCVFAKESFFTIADKARLFEQIAGTLRPGGQLCFTDYMLPESAKPTRAVDLWMANEPQEPFPCSSQDILDLLAHHKLDVRIAEDITDMHQALILQGWRDLTQALAPGSVAPETLPHLVNEAELWARRGAVLRSGDVRVYRFYALKAGDPVS